MVLTGEIIILSILVLLSAFFSGVETAIFSISKLRIKHLIEIKKRGAITLDKLKSQPHRLLITILIGNNLVNIGASALATSIAIDMFSSNAIGIATGVMTFIILLFGEITPKTFATVHSESISLLIAKPIKILEIILWPFIMIFDGWTKLITTKKASKDPIITEEELKTIVSLGEEAGEIKEIEKRLIHNIFEFDTTNVSEVMTPRTDIFAVSATKKLRDVINPIIKSGHTRVPVYEKDMDHIVGIIRIKDLIKYLKDGKKQILISKVMHKPYFVPANKKIDSLMKQFLIRKEHMAIVLDEHGGVAGVVTLENVIEEIIGEIQDETDKIEPHVKKTKKKTWKVLGKASIEEVNQALKSKFKQSTSYDTISGLVLDKIGKIPKKNEEFTIDKHIFKIEDMEDNRILEIKIIKK
jgi:putative hemolysin